MKTVQLEEIKKLTTALVLIEDAKNAFIGIGDMMQPDRNEGDEQLNLVHRSQAAAIFRFFGNALEGPVCTINDIKDRLELSAMKDGMPRPS